MTEEEKKKLDDLRNSLNEKRREKIDQFWLAIFNAAIMFLSIATPLFMTSGSWSATRRICVQVGIVCMFVTVLSLLIVLRRLARYYKGVVLEMTPVFNGEKSWCTTTTNEFVWYEVVLSVLALVCFIVGMIAVFMSVFF